MKNPLIVSKFGGTSMADALAMRQSAKIAAQRCSGIVVVSATAGTTNQLIELAYLSEARQTEVALERVEAIVERHRKIATDLQISKARGDELELLFEELQSLSRGIELLRDASPRVLDVMMSLGERMSSLLFVEALQEILNEKSSGEASQKTPQEARWLDAREIVKTDDQFGRAKPLLIDLKKRIEPLTGDLHRGKCVYVTQGFIGSTEEGLTTTLGRGGSDYSAALFAEAFEATSLEIWTDVPGIATTDPRICPEARSIPEISFTETSELATFGAKVLHPATLLPAWRQNIPVFVGSTFEPEAPGTWVRHRVDNQPLVRAIATRKKQVLLTLTTPDMLQTHGFLYQIFKVFNDHQVSVDAVTTSEVSVSMTLDNSALINKKLVHDLGRFAEVKVEEDLALVALIGNQINHTPGLAKRLFELIEGINVRMICLGASRHNFCILVKEDKANEVVQKWHRSFIES